MNEYKTPPVSSELEGLPKNTIFPLEKSFKEYLDLFLDDNTLSEKEIGELRSMKDKFQAEKINLLWEEYKDLSEDTKQALQKLQEDFSKADTTQKTDTKEKEVPMQQEKKSPSNSLDFSKAENKTDETLKWKSRVVDVNTVLNVRNETGEITENLKKWQEVVLTGNKKVLDGLIFVEIDWGKYVAEKFLQEKSQKTPEKVDHTKANKETEKLSQQVQENTQNSEILEAFRQEMQAEQDERNWKTIPTQEFLPEQKPYANAGNVDENGNIVPDTTLFDTKKLTQQLEKVYATQRRNFNIWEVRIWDETYDLKISQDRKGNYSLKIFTSIFSHQKIDLPWVVTKENGKDWFNITLIREKASELQTQTENFLKSQPKK